jgi:hypothetical protein
MKMKKDERDAWCTRKKELKEGTRDEDRFGL